MIRALIFDCFGVLYSDGKTHIKNLCPPEKEAELSSLYLQADYGYLTTAEFKTQVAELLGISVSELEHVILKRHVRNEPLVDYIRHQKSQFKIGLLSNVGSTFLDELMNKDDQKELFDAVVLSSHVGITKPAAEIYELAAEQLGVSPEACIMIDDIPVNVDGAKKVGMVGILFTSNQQLGRDINLLTGEHSA